MYLFLTLNMGLPVDIFTHRASTFSKIYIKKIKINFKYLRKLWGLDLSSWTVLLNLILIFVVRFLYKKMTWPMLYILQAFCYIISDLPFSADNITMEKSDCISLCALRLLLLRFSSRGLSFIWFNSCQFFFIFNFYLVMFLMQ